MEKRGAVPHFERLLKLNFYRYSKVVNSLNDYPSSLQRKQRIFFNTVYTGSYNSHASEIRPRTRKPGSYLYSKVCAKQHVCLQVLLSSQCFSKKSPLLATGHTGVMLSYVFSEPTYITRPYSKDKERIMDALNYSSFD